MFHVYDVLFRTCLWVASDLALHVYIVPRLPTLVASATSCLQYKLFSIAAGEIVS